MSLHRYQQLGLGRTDRQAQHSIQRIQLEIVAMWLARRWGRATLAQTAEIGLPLKRPIDQRARGRNMCGQVMAVVGEIEQHSMHPCPGVGL